MMGEKYENMTKNIERSTENSNKSLDEKADGSPAEDKDCGSPTKKFGDKMTFDVKTQHLTNT